MQTRPSPLALIAISCRLPGGADDPRQFWRRLCSGHDAISMPGPKRRASLGPGAVEAAGYLGDIAGFDPLSFNISPAEARELDPQQRLLLELGWELFEDAGVGPRAMAGTRTGVFVGAMWSEYAELLSNESQGELRSISGRAPRPARRLTRPSRCGKVGAMARTFEESRPTPVTVIGWAWVVIGGFMILSACFNLSLILFVVAPASPANTPFATMPNFIVPMSLAQLGVGVLGIVAGRDLLALRAWARTVLEVCSWLFVLGLIGFAVFWIKNNFSLMSEMDSGGSFFQIMSLFPIAIYGTPLGLMIYHLRTDKVRNALSSDPKP